MHEDQQTIDEEEAIDMIDGIIRHMVFELEGSNIDDMTPEMAFGTLNANLMMLSLSVGQILKNTKMTQRISQALMPKLTQLWQHLMKLVSKSNIDTWTLNMGLIPPSANVSITFKP